MRHHWFQNYFTTNIVQQLFSKSLQRSKQYSLKKNAMDQNFLPKGVVHAEPIVFYIFSSSFYQMMGCIITRCLFKNYHIF